LSARLFALSGDDLGRSCELSGATVLGRAADADFVLGTPSVSRHHARLVPEGVHWVLEDLGSSNGTFVGGQRVQRAELEDGAVFRLGDLELRLRFESPVPAQPSDATSAPSTRRPAAAAPAPAPPAGERRTAGGGRVLQYSRTRRGGTFLSSDLSQRSALVRWSVYVLSAALFASLAWGAFRLTRAVRERAADDAPYEAVR